MVTLKYSDETDRAYGLGGMSACMCLMENDRYIDSVSLDSEADRGLSFTPDFFHSSNPQLSAKSVWRDNVSHFRLLSGLMVSNVMCRAMLRHHEAISRQLSQLMCNQLIEEGSATCGLDEDEIREVFDSSMSYMQQVFSHPLVAPMVESFVEAINRDRTLQGETVATIFRRLIP